MGTAWKRDWGFVIELYEVVFSVLDSGYCRDGYFLFFDFLLEQGKEGSRSESIRQMRKKRTRRWDENGFTNPYTSEFLRILERFARILVRKHATEVDETKPSPSFGEPRNDGS